MNDTVFGASRRIAGLDGLRGIAILGVLLEHSWVGIPGWEISHAGRYGVDLFCSLSAFLIASLLLRERRETGTIHFGHFYLRRALRIFPAYFTLVFLCFGGALLWPGNPDFAVVPTMMPYLLTFTANLLPTMNFLGALWSVCAEEQFYLVWPALEKFLPGKGKRVALLVLFVLNVGFAIAAWKQLFHPRLHIANATFQPFVLGVALALFCDDPPKLAWLRRWTAAHAPVLLAALAALYLFATAQRNAIVGPKRLFIEMLVVAFLAMVVAQGSPRLTRWLQWAPLARLGRVSYGVYLIHMPLVKLSGFHRGSLLTPVATLALSWGLAEISFRFLETPFLRRQERFRPRPPVPVQEEARMPRTASR